MLCLAVVASCECHLFAADTTATPLAAIFKLVPEDSLALLIINPVDKVEEQIGKVASQLKLPDPHILAGMKKQLGIAEGIDDHGAAFVAFVKGESEMGVPVGIRFIPVTDYARFIAQFKPESPSAEIVEVSMGERRLVVGHKGNFAVVANLSDRETLKKVLDGATSIASSLEPLADWIQNREVVFVMTRPGIQRAVAAAQQGLAMVKMMLANSGDESTKMAANNLEIYDHFLTAANKELRQFAVGFHVDSDGDLYLESRAVFVEGGTWAASGKAVAQYGSPNLAGLPGGPFLFAVAGPMPQAFTQGMMNMSVDIINKMSKAAGGNELNEEQSKELNKLMAMSSAEVNSMSMVMGVPTAGESIYSGMSGIIKVKNAKLYIANYQQVMKSMRDLFTNAGVHFPFFQDIETTQIGGQEGIKLTMQLTEMVGMPNEASKKMLEAMIGQGGKLSIYLAPIDETTVAMSYVSSDGITHIKATLQNPTSGLADSADVAATQRLLSTKAQWIAYVSPAGFLDLIEKTMFTMAPPGAKVPKFPPFPQTPPIGIGAELSERWLDFQIVVPGEALKGVGTFHQQIRHQNN
jgi:hypothetical protein